MGGYIEEHQARLNLITSCRCGETIHARSRVPEEDQRSELVMKFVPLDSFLVFTILSFPSGLTIQSLFSQTTFLTLVFLLISHQGKGTKDNQAWDYSRSASSNRSTVRSTSTEDPKSSGSYLVGLAANHATASRSASSASKIWT